MKQIAELKEENKSLKEQNQKLEEAKGTHGAPDKYAKMLEESHK